MDNVNNCGELLRDNIFVALPFTVGHKIADAAAVEAPPIELSLPDLFPVLPPCDHRCCDPFDQFSWQRLFVWMLPIASLLICIV